MKMSIELDLTPQEARKLMGLPDVEAMQKKVVDIMFQELKKSVEGIKDPEKLWQRFMPLGQSLDQLQKFMPDFGKLAGSDDDKDKSKDD